MPCNRAPGTGNVVPGLFINWAHNVTANPQRIFQPTTLDELVAIVKQAEANDLSVRAVGSGWSFTDIMVSPDYMVYTSKLNQILSETMTGNAYPADPVFGALTAGARQRLLCHVEAGIKIHDLHDQLENNFQPAPGQNPPPGIILNDGPGGAPQPHGYAVKTLGGSGGQSIVGAALTSVHGGDDHDRSSAPIKALPDMIQGIHLVGAGGAEFFLQRGGSKAIVDPALLGQLMPCVAGRVFSDDDVFNAAVVSMGRMGIIYSVVIEVRPQYVLLENRVQDTWKNVSSGNTLKNLRTNNRFLQVLILPYGDSNGDHTCFVTTRNETTPNGPPTPSPGFNFFTFACEESGPVLAAMIAGVIGGLSAAVAELLLIPIVGPLLAAADTLLITALTPLLDPGVTIGDYLATIVNIAAELGALGACQQLVNSILSSAQSLQVRQDLSYKIMDTYDYKGSCSSALSLEVAFDADAGNYLDFVQAVFGLIDNFASQNILVGAYISLRYCAGSDALLAIEHWPHTVCVEIAALGGLANDMLVLNSFEAEAVRRGGIVHWGQLNSRSRADIEAAFPATIGPWRFTLAQLSANGKLSTFDNDFCRQRGLEVIGTVRKRSKDVSYLVPLLLEQETSKASRDVSYLVPLLLDGDP